MEWSGGAVVPKLFVVFERVDDALRVDATDVKSVHVVGVQQLRNKYPRTAGSVDLSISIGKARMAHMIARRQESRAEISPRLHRAKVVVPSPSPPATDPREK